MISKVLSRLCVGDSNFERRDLDKLGINYVINVGGKTTDYDDYRMHLTDDGTNPRYKFSTIIGHIENKLMSNYTILVCCRAGISRSAYIVLLWLIKMGMSKEEALQFLKSRHKVTQINLDLMRGF